MTEIERELIRAMAAESEDDSPKREPREFAFDDKRDIVRGVGRIVLAAGDGLSRVPGWALPGCGRTQDEGRAIDAARMIDEMSR